MQLTGPILGVNYIMYRMDFHWVRTAYIAMIIEINNLWGYWRISMSLQSKALSKYVSGSSWRKIARSASESCQSQCTRYVLHDCCIAMGFTAAKSTYFCMRVTLCVVNKTSIPRSSTSNAPCSPKVRWTGKIASPWMSYTLGSCQSHPSLLRQAYELSEQARTSWHTSVSLKTLWRIHLPERFMNASFKVMSAQSHRALRLASTC